MNDEEKKIVTVEEFVGHVSRYGLAKFSCEFVMPKTTNYLFGYLNSVELSASKRGITVHFLKVYSEKKGVHEVRVLDKLPSMYLSAHGLRLYYFPEKEYVRIENAHGFKSMEIHPGIYEILGHRIAEKPLTDEHGRPFTSVDAERLSELTFPDPILGTLADDNPLMKFLRRKKS